jgi:hypothetical protein
MKGPQAILKIFESSEYWELLLNDVLRRPVALEIPYTPIVAFVQGLDLCELNDGLS